MRETHEQGDKVVLKEAHVVLSGFHFILFLFIYLFLIFKLFFFFLSSFFLIWMKKETRDIQKFVLHIQIVIILLPFSISYNICYVN